VLKSIEIKNFRSCDSTTLDLNESVTALVGKNGVGRRLLHGGIGPDCPLARIQVVDSRGQDTFTESGGSQQGSGPVTLRLAPSPRSGESTEIRLWSVVSAAAKIPFEFDDLPMP
jgi:hypothetical protein